MNSIEREDRSLASFREARGEIRLTVGKLLEREGIPPDRTDVWIRERLFGRVSRLLLAAGGVFGFDYGIPEQELVRDFAEATCTEDVIDSLHEYGKTRGRLTLFGHFVRPDRGKSLKFYWGIRRRAAKSCSPGATPRAAESPEE